MVHFLKHYALRVWGTIILGGILSLWWMPLLQVFTGLKFLPFFFVLICAVIYFGLAIVMEHLVQSRIDLMIKEALIWERGRLESEAQKAYQKAAALFDSFMLSPLGQKRKAARLLGRLARFYLARPEKNRAVEDFLLAYFIHYPEDEEAVREWLTQIGNQIPDGAPKYQDAITAIGQAQAASLVIQRKLARMYLNEDRTDFTALQTYYLIFDQNEAEDQDIFLSLAELFVREGRADEWALKVYVRALNRYPDQWAFKKGVAACITWLSRTDQNQEWFLAAEPFLAGIEPDDRIQMVQGFHRPGVPHETGYERGIKRIRESVKKAGIAVLQVLARIFNQCGQQGRRALKFIGWTATSRYGLIVIGSTIILVFLGILGVKTTTYFNPHQPRTVLQKENAARPSAHLPQIEKRFTIQVAAFYKKGHARKYVRELRQKQADAYWIESKGGKRRWYLVRVAHFADKQSARALGEKLKKAGIINDYYVANYIK